MRSEREVRDKLKDLVEQLETCKTGTSVQVMLQQRAVALAWVCGNPKISDLVLSEDYLSFYGCLY